MRLLKTAVLILSLLPAHAHATNVSSFISPAKITDEQKLCKGKHTNSSKQVPHFSKMIRKVAWYQDRDNSMKDIDINEDSIDGKVGRAMATFFGRGVTQGIQVCSGVTLLTAHTNLDDPRHADCSKPLDKDKKCKIRKLRPPSKHFGGGSTYPVSEETYTQFPLKNSQFISPRLRNKSNWRKKPKDYLFFRTDNSLRPNDFIKPLNMTAVELFDASEKYGFKTYLYRGKTRFNLDENGIPDFNFETRERDFVKLKEIYKVPQKVIMPCKFALRRDRSRLRFMKNLTATDCPIEDSVSGSHMISIINDKPYLVGTVTRAHNESISNFKRAGKEISGKIGSTFVNSSSYCQDYLLACGRPCATLEEALKEE